MAQSEQTPPRRMAANRRNLVQLPSARPAWAP